MSYSILDPSSPNPAFAGLCALAIMAKAPREGKVKTRLAPPLTLAQSAALNICFLRDTARNLSEIPGAQGIVCYTPVGEEAAFNDLFPESFVLIPQRSGDFGERLFAAAQDILACGFASVCLIDSDSPTVPSSAFAAAVAHLGAPGERIVLGPSHDGGYYLIGMKTARPEPFANITWSTSFVAEETRERCRSAGLALTGLPLWYDVDDGETLATLRQELLGQRPPAFVDRAGYPASATHDFLAELDQEMPPGVQADSDDR